VGIGSLCNLVRSFVVKKEKNGNALAFIRYKYVTAKYRHQSSDIAKITISDGAIGKSTNSDGAIGQAKNQMAERELK
jgi:hypothetical protein